MAFHKQNNRIVTLTAIQPSGKFGALSLSDDSSVSTFLEKPKGDGAWINGGFFVVEPKAFDYIKNGDSTIWEREPLEGLSKDNQLIAYKHYGFWHPMDTLKDKSDLEKNWNSNNCEWRIWE
jgi:glucose-1-phosphate cytidylyltransferase